MKKLLVLLAIAGGFVACKKEKAQEVPEMEMSIDYDEYYDDDGAMEDYEDVDSSDY